MSTKYIVICYAIHDKFVAGHIAFDTYEEASKHLREDAQGTYEEEIENSGNDDISIDVCGWHASVIDKDAGCYWTWDIIVEEF